MRDGHRRPAPAWSHRPALDGVRSIAVYLVLLFHSGLAVAAGGFVGVDLFFVLSGFLITNVLLGDLDTSGRIRFGRFYARRARRLLPAALLVVVVTALAYLLVASIVQRLSYVGDAQSALLYVANWHFMAAQNDYFATDASRSPFLHFWSLAIEEQFYLAFPLLLLVLARTRRLLRVLPLVGLLGLLAASVAAQLFWSGADPNRAYYGTDSRAYQLLAGAVLAYCLRGARSRPSFVAADVLVSAAVGAVLLLGSGLLDVGVSVRGYAATAAGSVLIAVLALRDDGAAARFLSSPAVAYLGRISYGTYLWHWPVILVLREAYGVQPVASAVLTVVLATGLAAASYHVLEMPVRRSRVLDRVRWPTVAAGVAACAVTAVVVVPPVLDSPRRPVVSAHHVSAPRGAEAAVEEDGPAPEPPPPERPGGRADRQRVPAAIDWRAIARDQGPGHTCKASTPRRCIVVHGSGPHILLVGDSHARMIGPMFVRLAREHDFTLSMNAVSSCPWQAKVVITTRPPADQRACDRARDGWYDEALRGLDPDVVVLVEYRRDRTAVYGHTLRRIGGSTETLNQVLANTSDETVRRITSTGARVLIMKSTIVSAFDPVDCLARAKYLDRCAVPVPRRTSYLDGVFADIDAALRRVHTFDVNPAVCSGWRRCPAMVDGISVWRNQSHYTTEILVHVRADVWSRIVRTGVLDGV